MKKKIDRNKTTEAFKEIMTSKTIIPHLHFYGSSMLFPYWWNGNRKFARIKLSRLIKIIEWDKKDL